MAFGLDDPNAHAYDQAAEALAGMTDAEGRRLKVVRIPSPGRIIDQDHRSVPASHMNFLIANKAVIVPTYGAPPHGDQAGEFAVQALQSVFPDHTLLGLPSRALLTGGGSFHCISQQEPAGT
jgi:agmatine deiminase